MTLPSTQQPARARGATTPQPGAESSPLSAPRRALLLIVGSVALALGVVGIVLPVLPTTPFLLLAAACYARSSTRLYHWLRGQPSLGPIVSEWRATRSLPAGVKTRALIAVAVAFAISIYLVDVTMLRLLLAAVGIVVAVFLSRLPSAPAAPRSAAVATSAPKGDAS